MTATGPLINLKITSMHIQEINTVKKEMTEQIATKELILRINQMRRLIKEQVHKSPQLNLY